MKNRNYLHQLIYKTMTVSLIAFAVYACILTKTVRAQTSPSAKTEEAKRPDLFNDKFNDGRNWIDKGEWERAAKAFNEALEKFPQHDSADAALYWLAFCRKKQKKYQEAFAALDRLIKDYPDSAWVGDAQVMKLEIPPRLNPPGSNDKLGQAQYSADLQAQLVTGNVTTTGQNTAYADLLETTEQLPLSRADEIKIAAFRSLLNADPKRAVETMGEVLKPDSKASETLKQAILRVWRNPRLFASQALTATVAKNIGDKEFASLLRETLIKSFQSETNPNIRREIIFALAGIGDEQTTDFLKKSYAAESDREVKKAIINALGSSENALGGLNGSFTMRKLETDLARADVQKKNLSADERKNELDALLEIARSEKDTDLRRLAFSNVIRFSKWSGIDQVVETIRNLYDTETGEEFKVILINALAETEQPAAVRKLLDIAKNDKSDKLRLEAIRSLRNSKDPEVLKFLEDLIK